LKAKLISYVASPFHPVPEIVIQDVPLFEDLLRSVTGGNKLYLMINSPGGDADVAEKLLKMCRQRFQEFDVVVPDYAKSAATMIALGSDRILMGYLAELGPIDPQLRTAPFGGEIIPARSFIDGLEMIRDRVLKRRDPVQLYLPMISQIRPEILARCQSAIDGSREFAEKWLKRYMLKHDPNQAEIVAKSLSEGEKYKSHGKVIDFDEAKNELRLNVERIDPTSDLWNDIWELYCRQIQYLQQHQGQGAAKIFESESVSLTFNLQLLVGAPVPVRPPFAPPEQPPQHPVSPQPQTPTKPPPQRGKRKQAIEGKLGSPS
jgi:ClpP class serine protease